MVDFSFERSGDTGILVINGRLDTHSFEDLMAVLMTSLSNSGHLVIDLKKVNELDNSCKKLFCVACKTSSKLRKQLTITGNKTECVSSGQFDADCDKRYNSGQCSLVVH